MSADSAETPAVKTYRGNCHCKAFVFELQVPEIKVGFECNCSICSKKGYLWVFPPSTDAFKVVEGDEANLTEYTFGKKNLTHKFCPTCGTAIMGRGETKGMGVNIHPIQGIDTWDLQRHPFDGAAMDPQYTPATYSGPEPSDDIEGGKMYTGGCHCGAVTLALRSKPIDETYEEQIVQCNCSICERNAYLWVYPKKEHVVLLGGDNIGRYSFRQRFQEKTFCKICGVQLTNSREEPTEEMMEGMSEKSRAWTKTALKHHPVNLRVLDNFSTKGLKVKNYKGFTELKPEYVNP